MAAFTARLAAVVTGTVALARGTGRDPVVVLDGRQRGGVDH